MVPVGEADVLAITDGDAVSNVEEEREPDTLAERVREAP